MLCLKWYSRLISFLVPGAFVELNTAQLEMITPLKRLRIYTAGVWHNFVLAVLSVGVLAVLPVVLLPLYSLNNGVAVAWVQPGFTIASQLRYGTTVKSVNRCSVSSMQDWYGCLHTVQTGPVDGYCNTMTYVRTLNTSTPSLTHNFNEPECCNDTSTYRFCYSYDRHFVAPRTHKLSNMSVVTVVVDNPLDKRLSDNNYVQTKRREHACLPARKTMSARHPCQTNKDCGVNSLCLKPLTAKDIKIVRISHTQGQDVLFVGNPRELSSNVMLSDYVPKNKFISPSLPGQVSLLFKYLFSISAALAVLNMVPCSFLDGHQVLSLFLCLLCPGSTSVRPRVERAVVTFCSFLLGFVMLLAFYSLFIDLRAR